jgi:hypothetical protein
MNILEHAYKSYNKPLPWKYYMVRDSRTVFSLWPEQPIPPTSHHALRRLSQTNWHATKYT